jgi:hypothetical protein
MRRAETPAKSFGQNAPVSDDDGDISRVRRNNSKLSAV